jgi:hypothetical protein
MAHGIVHHSPGGQRSSTRPRSRSSIANGGKDLPEGETFHAAGPAADGWVAVAIHDSRESWERFRDET